MPPECLLGCKYDKSSDIYALGVTMYELMQLKRPFKDKNINKWLCPPFFFNCFIKSVKFFFEKLFKAVDNTLSVVLPLVLSIN